MEQLKSIYLAGLLHDIGKFIERAKDKTIQAAALKYFYNNEASKNYAHRRYSAWFVEKFADKKEFLKSDTVKTLVLWHHKGDDKTKDDYDSINKKGILLKLLRIADDLASSERKENNQLNAVEYFRAKIHSPFQDIIFNDNQKIKKLEKEFYIDTTTLTIESKSGFPNPDLKNVSDTEVYPELVKEFLNEFENIEDEDALLSLMEKYLVNVPAQTPVEINGVEKLYKPDINLYDHSRSVAAIAVCLYLEYLNGTWKDKDRFILTNNYIKEENLEPPIILINGNLSGIQNFIFDVESKKAAQKLKGKSFFVQLLTDVIAKFIIENLGLKQANILYNGGGNFYILSPSYQEKTFTELSKKIDRALKSLNIHLTIGITKVKLEDFSDFSAVFSKVTELSKINKLQKFKRLPHQEVFGTISQTLNEDDSYIDLTNELTKAIDFLIKDFINNEKISEYQKPFNELNHSIEMHNEKSQISYESILFNNTDFSKDYKGFRFAVKDLPLWNDTNIGEFIAKNKEIDNKFDISSEENKIYPNTLISFERFSQMAYFETGTQKLGVLKMDIDNLGKIFSDGLPDRIEYIKENGEKDFYSLRSISRIASLSRSIKWFFEGYMNTLLKLTNFRDKLYVVFAGGDDFFLVGAWNYVFDFALKVRNDFNEFVCNHPGITLSAALLIVDEKYPVSSFAKIAEDRLHDAKYKSPAKNSINIFNTTISWNDFIEAKKLKIKLVELVKIYNVNRSILEKIRKSSRGFDKVQNDALKGNVSITKVWRLAYYLRDIINNNRKDENIQIIKSKVEDIVKQYETLVFEALQGRSTSIKIFPIAARWAEFETRYKM